MNTDETIKLYIPKELIKSEEEHPEEYGELIVVLKNNMWTDVYSDKEGNLYTLTNDAELIEYINSFNNRRL